MSWRNIQRNENVCCENCLSKILRKNKSFTYKEVKLWIEVESGSGCKLLSVDYTNSHQKLKLQCQCGNIFQATLNGFNRANKRQCNKCSGVVSWNAELIAKYISNHSNVKPLNINENLKYLSNLKLRCGCGEVYETNFSNFKKNKYKCCYNCMIKKRSENIRNSYDEIKNNIESIESYKLISKIYKNYRRKLKIKCPKGHVFYMSYKNFYYEGCRCLICSESKGEKRVREYLSMHSLKHKRQFTFDDLKGVGGSLLRFDFAVLDELNNLKLLIEYDGEFHFNKQYDADGFEILQAHDKLKNDYCKNKNIKLIRIPYWEFENIEKILKGELDESI